MGIVRVVRAKGSRGHLALRLSGNNRTCGVLSMRSVKVLVTGAIAPGFVSIVRALGSSKKYDMTVIGSDYKTAPSSSYFADRVYQLPDNRSPEFSGALLDLCTSEGIDVLLPIRTDDQLPICRNLAKFHNAGIEPALVVTDPALMDIVLNKRKLLDYCRDVIGMKTPGYRAATTAEGLTQAVSALGYPDVPVVIKPSHSMGSRGFRILDESIDRRTLFFEEKPMGIYSTLPAVFADIGNEFPELLAMEYLPGNEYTLDILCRKGETFAVLPRLRVGTLGGITTRGVLARDSNYEMLMRIAESLVEGLGLSYNVGVQARESKSGVPLLLEVNPRLQGTTVLSVEGGVNIPEMLVQMALHEYDYKQKFHIRWGLEMQRVWLELFSHEGRTWIYGE